MRNPNSCQLLYSLDRSSDADLLEVDFHAGHEQHGDGSDDLHRRKKRDGMNQAKHMRPDHHSEQNFQNGNRNAHSDGYFGQEGAMTATASTTNIE